MVLDSTAHTAKNTVISSDFLLWKFCGKARFLHSFGQRPKLCGNCAFPQNFHTRKSGEINFFAVTVSKRDVLLHPLLFYVDCDSALGMESNFIPDKVITASSFLSSNPANYARLNTGKSNNNSWCASEVDKSQYLEVCIKTISCI